MSDVVHSKLINSIMEHVKTLPLSNINLDFSNTTNNTDNSTNTNTYYYQTEKKEDKEREICTICLDEINDNNVINPPCNHKFHLHCFVDNLAQGCNPLECPNCRSRIITEEDIRKIYNNITPQDLQNRLINNNAENIEEEDEEFIEDLREFREREYRLRSQVFQ